MSTKGTCAVCSKPISVEEPHDRVYKHRNCQPGKLGGQCVYVLVKTNDKDPYTYAHYECAGESEVIGVYASYRQALKAKENATEGMDEGSNEDDYNYGTDQIYTFTIFEETIEDDEDDSSGDDDDDDDDE